ncbi:hypothetical protein AB0F17_34840 [Nonomuraea sp. NPDC026600]|uniref:hypothetical protein n=1 Tax=Nonomuraea sp. NPDC026600 TaxID=3155363 RepID=UPI003403540C
MDLKPGHRLTFVISSEARYAQVVPVPDIYVTSESDQGLDWTFRIRQGSDSSDPAEVHGALAVHGDECTPVERFPEFFDAITARQPARLVDVARILRDLGAIDDTPRKPYPPGQ